MNSQKSKENYSIIILKKLTKYLVTALFLIVPISSTIYAQSSTYNVNYKTYGGNGRSNGKTNGYFHNLSKGNAYLKVSYNSHNNTGSKASLYHNDLFAIDHLYGTVSSNIGTRKFAGRVSSRGGYYLQFWGGHAQKTYKIKGTLHN